jgi:hypothetical protein
MTRDKVLEHMARAMCLSDTGSRTAYDNSSQGDRANYLDRAEAALTALEAVGVKLCEGEPTAWTWEQELDPTGEVIHGKTVPRVAFHWSTPPKTAEVTPLYRAIATGRWGERAHIGTASAPD